MGVAMGGGEVGPARGRSRPLKYVLDSSVGTAQVSTKGDKHRGGRVTIAAPQTTINSLWSGIAHPQAAWLCQLHDWPASLITFHAFRVCV